MDISERLEQIELLQMMLGRYTHLISLMHERDQITKQEYIKELSYIKNKLIEVRGVDDEDVLIVDNQIKELD